MGTSEVARLGEVPMLVDSLVCWLVAAVELCMDAGEVTSEVPRLVAAMLVD